MEEEGLVTRTRSKKDERVVTVDVTEKGWQLREVTHRIFISFFPWPFLGCSDNFAGFYRNNFGLSAFVLPSITVYINCLGGFKPFRAIPPYPAVSYPFCPCLFRFIFRPRACLPRMASRRKRRRNAPAPSWFGQICFSSKAK